MHTSCGEDIQQEVAQMAALGNKFDHVSMPGGTALYTAQN